MRTIVLAVVLAAPAVAQSGVASLTAEQWRSDLAFLSRELPARHKNAFARLSKADFQKQVREFDARIPKLSGPEIRANVLKLLASLGDAHTSIWGWGGVNAFRYLPVGFSWFSDGVFVTTARPACRELLGGRLKRIGRMSVEDACRALAPYISHENEACLRVNMPGTMQSSDLLYAAGVAESPERVQLEFEMPDGGLKQVELDGAFPPGSAKGLAKASPWFQGESPLWRRNRRRVYWASVVDGGATVYFQYNRCTNDPKQPFAAFLASLREMLDGPDVKRVIVDLRANGGGNSQVFAPFIKLIRSSRFNRKGRLYVLIGRATFSSAVMHAIQLRHRTAAIFMGEPTGGKPNCYGDVRTFDLPNSRIKIAYSTKYFRMAKDDAPSVMPDILVEESSKDYVTGIDPVLDAVPRNQ